MRFIQIIAVILLFIGSGCSLSDDQKAGKIFDEAQQKFIQKEYNSAKILIDSIIQHHPKSIEYSVRSRELLLQIQKSEQRHNLAFLEELLDQKEQELKPLMSQFSEQLEVGEIPVLVHKRQKIENSFHRSYLQAYVNKAGEFYLVSRYTGTFPLAHEQIRVYTGKREVFSEVIESGDFYNRMFQDDQIWWETIQYKEGRDNGIADFISRHHQEPLKVEFIGKRRHYAVMETFDKEAIRDGYEISFVLKEIAKIKEQIRNVKRALSKFS